MRLYAHENFVYVFHSGALRHHVRVRWMRPNLISACGANSAVEATSIPQASGIDRVPMPWQNIKLIDVKTRINQTTCSKAQAKITTCRKR